MTFLCMVLCFSGEGMLQNLYMSLLFYCFPTKSAKLTDSTPLDQRASQSP